MNTNQYKHTNTPIAEVKHTGINTNDMIQQLWGEMNKIKQRVSFLERENRRLKSLVDSIQSKR